MTLNFCTLTNLTIKLRPSCVMTSSTHCKFWTLRSELLLIYKHSNQLFCQLPASYSHLQTLGSVTVSSARTDCGGTNTSLSRRTHSLLFKSSQEILTCETLTPTDFYPQFPDGHNLRQSSHDRDSQHCCLTQKSLCVWGVDMQLYECARGTDPSFSRCQSKCTFF